MDKNWKNIIFYLGLMILTIYTVIFKSLETGLLIAGCVLLFDYLVDKPKQGILWTVFLSGFGTLSLYEIGPVHIKAYQVVLLTLMIVLVIHTIREGSKLFLPKGYGGILCLFMLSLILSFINCIYPAVLIKQLFLLSIYILLMLAIINIIKNKNILVSLSSIIVVSAYAACLYSILLILHVIPNSLSNLTYHFVRPTSFFAEPNEFGLFLVFVFGFVFALLLATKKVRFWIIFALIIANIIPNMSRGSWLGMMVSMGIIVYFFNVKNIYKTDIIRATLVFLVVVGMISIALTTMSRLIPTKYKSSVEEIVQERATSLFSASDPTRDIRYQSNLAALDAFWEHPFVGRGLGNAFVILEKKYDNKDISLTELPPIVAATSSNFISDLAIETGLFGLVSFLCLIHAVIKQGLRNIRSTKDRQSMIIAIGAFASFIGIIINGLTYAMHMLPFFWITAGILSIRITQISEADYTDLNIKEKV
ncbi:MAG: O-antigen ligase family protein [bacterium]|nr:O-antigen ligase family protein [bacterium]